MPQFISLLDLRLSLPAYKMAGVDGAQNVSALQSRPNTRGKTDQEVEGMVGS